MRFVLAHLSPAGAGKAGVARGVGGSWRQSKSLRNFGQDILDPVGGGKKGELSCAPLGYTSHGAYRDQNSNEQQQAIAGGESGKRATQLGVKPQKEAAGCLVTRNLAAHLLPHPGDDAGRAKLRT